MPIAMDIKKTDDIAVIKSGFAIFERVGEIAIGECSGVRYEQVGEISRFTQYCKSPSLRLARSALKAMREAAFK